MGAAGRPLALSALLTLSASRVAMAGGGGGSSAQQSFMTTPTFVLATLVAFFLVCTLLFKYGTEHLIHYLRKAKREGLANAVATLVEELTAIGFISLLLTAMQGAFESICVSYSTSVSQTWNYLDNVDGCDCCLASTGGVDRCFAYSRQCGADFCNCGAQDPACLADYPLLANLTGRLTKAADLSGCSCGASGLQVALGYLEVETTELELTCTGILSSGGCPPGQVPFVTATTMHQVHILIFVVAIMHVTMGMVMILLASLRVAIWRRWPEDELQRAVRDENDERLDQQVNEARGRGLPGAGQASTRSMKNRLALAHSKWVQQASLERPSLEAALEAPQGAAEQAAAAKRSVSRRHSRRADVESGGGSLGQAHGAAANGSALPGTEGQRSHRWTVTPLSAVSEWFGPGGDGREYAISFLASFRIPPVSRDEFNIMRASFMKQNQVPSNFDFMKYINLSLQDDFSHVVGISLLEWSAFVLLMLISGPLGWPAMLFLIISAVLQIAVNTKLAHIIRHVCRDGAVNQLDSHVFWFNKPTLLLHPIRFNLFLTSFMFSAPLFFWWQFGASSCFFTSHRSSFWFAWAGPWWTSLIYSAVMIVDLCMRTLPMYSLAVQMGSDFKHHMLPKGVQNKLLLIAQDMRRKFKEQEARGEEDGSLSAPSGVMSLLTRKPARGGDAAPAPH